MKIRLPPITIPNMKWKIAFFIIPMLSLTCMLISGCEGTEDHAVQSGNLTSSEQLKAPPGAITTSSQTNQQISLNSSNQERPRIVAFGDSLTAGLGVPPQESYPSRLQRLLDEAGYHYQVVNAGVSGDTTAGGLRRIDWVLKSRPRIVILELGANDGLRGQPIENIYENLRKILQRLKEADVKVLFTGMRIPPNYGIDYTTRFSDLYTRLAKEFDVSFMPFFLEEVAARRSLNQADGIHPTGEGYRIIVKNIFTALRPILQAPLERQSYSRFK